MGLLACGRRRVVRGASRLDVYRRPVGAAPFASRLFSQRSGRGCTRIARVATRRSPGSFVSTDVCFGAGHRDICLATTRKNVAGRFVEADARNTIPASMRDLAAQYLREPLLE